ncbi:MAG: aminotransferase class IV [Verrucomicrobiota bacterium]
MNELPAQRSDSANTPPQPSRIWINGELVAREDAAVSPFDHGFLTGDGVFETMKTYGGEPFEYERHYARLANAAKMFGLTMPTSDGLLESIKTVLLANGEENADVRLRVTLTGGDAPLGSEKGEDVETLVIASGALPSHPDMGAVVTVPYTRNESGVLAGLKTTSYGENVIALKFAKEKGANEAIFPNTKGHLCEGTGSNIFVVLDGQLITPPLSAGCLAGVTRAVILELCEAEGIAVKEIDLPIEQLAKADEAFLSSTLREVLPITAVDGKDLPCPGPISLEVRHAFQKRIRS